MCFRSSVFCGRGELLLVRTVAFAFITFKIFYIIKDIWFKTLLERHDRSIKMI